jgi:hypothetical protein
MKKFSAAYLVALLCACACTPQTSSPITFAETTSIAATTSSDAVSLGEARLIAAYYSPTGLEHSFTEPILYLNSDMSPAAYEFNYLRDGKSAGFVMVAARKDWSPMLESSDGAAPSSRVPEAFEVAVAKGYVAPGENPPPTYFYFGALSNSVQFGEKMKSERVAIELGWGGAVFHLPDAPVKLSFNAYKARSSWQGTLALASRLYAE